MCGLNINIIQWPKAAENAKGLYFEVKNYKALLPFLSFLKVVIKYP